jgi:hypothetical protein
MLVICSNEVFASHQTGRVAQVEALYWWVLAIEPAHADASHFLGFVAYQGGGLTKAETRYCDRITPNLTITSGLPRAISAS